MIWNTYSVSLTVFYGSVLHWRPFRCFKLQLLVVFRLLVMLVLLQLAPQLSMFCIQQSVPRFLRISVLPPFSFLFPFSFLSSNSGNYKSMSVITIPITALLRPPLPPADHHRFRLDTSTKPPV
ncbi:hypothetical protein BC939DRAFT_276423 [Gamsiella multidivaricata]|uniref:uncharacterized protein n=1 Tax=Gamsiella multidivaricata TaxID=101098 RepID=UPI00221E45D1|nr:uncharacterized protein BC939DRAFT_276423 [Gamsiella multidivaricata]KAI7818853.1 hypothetical protein BC939DRAFT_276423 [Gamsiella multidivaricata]